MRRIEKREGGYMKFEAIREHLLEAFGAGPLNSSEEIARVLTEAPSRFRLQIRNLHDMTEVREVVMKLHRPVLAIFQLTERKWTRFSEFFRENRTGVLTAEDFLEPLKNGGDRDAGAHAVVLLNVTNDFLVFQNSWGRSWADKGRFRVKNETVLGFVQFFDVFWCEKDLLDSEREAFARQTRKTETTFVKTPERAFSFVVYSRLLVLSLLWYLAWWIFFASLRFA